MIRLFVSVLLRFIPLWILERLIANLFFEPLSLFFQGTFSLPHNCGAVAPQLWGSCTKIVGQLHHSCGAMGIKEIKTRILLAGTRRKEQKIF